ncbi:MAG: D-aminoacylase [Paraglaciecola sp.]|uniref:N-acyl-D-amino-acid deacylase family protein n=1 Tax=Paraglaciecola sp. TaxID=1920173 RepID=UPI0032999E67
MQNLFKVMSLSLLLTAGCSNQSVDNAAVETTYDLIVRNGKIYDGNGGLGFTGDIAVNADRIVAINKNILGHAKKEIDARGNAVAPGFINILSWSGETLLADGRGQSALRQGITLEVMGEGISMGPLSPSMKVALKARQGATKYDIAWTTLGEYLQHVADRGTSINIASYLGAATARWNILGPDDVDPTPEQLKELRKLVKTAMEEGALGVASSLIYAPGVYAETDELVALTEVAGSCGGIYATHMRSEGDRFLEAIDETIEISKRANTPAHIFHLKVGGVNNWDKMARAAKRIEQVRDNGVRITADMYPYAASGTGLSASMPPWVQKGGHNAWIKRLQDPTIRAKVIADMRDPNPDWENVMQMAGGGENVLLAMFNNPKLKPLIGKTLADVAKERGISVEEAAIELVIEDNSRVNVIYYTMSEDNLKRKIVLPYVSFSSDGMAISAEGNVLKSAQHPRSYGAFSRVFSHYVRDLKLITVAQAVHRMSAAPADILGLKDRGRLKVGNYADIVIFNIDTIQDYATYTQPHQYSKGVSTVIINGVEALRDGEPTSARPGQVVRGRAWTGWSDGGCRSSASDWDWNLNSLL